MTSPALLLCVVGALASAPDTSSVTDADAQGGTGLDADDAGAGARPQDADAALPDALPPLDDRLLAIPGAPPVRAFAQGRLRAELDDARDFARVGDTAVGATLTGRVGVEATADGTRATIVLGDGGRLGQPVRTPTLVTRPIASPLYQAELAFDVALFGVPSVVSFGRAPLVVADGRWVGAEPWDARGRTLDGARVALHGSRFEGLVGAFYLGPYVLADEAPLADDPSALGVLSVRGRPLDATLIDIYALLHRDGSDRAMPITAPTLGARARTTFDFVDVLTLEIAAGGDVQGAILDERSEELFAGTSAHAELGARVATELSSLTEIAPDPFLRVALEATGGDIVGGRSWRAPAPTQHAALGVLDLFGPDNTWSALGAIGGTTPGGLVLEGGVRMVGVIDALGPLVDPAGTPIGGRRVGAGLALVEGAGQLVVPLRGASQLDVTYALGLPGIVLGGDSPAQRLLITLTFAADSDDDTPLPPL